MRAYRIFMIIVVLPLLVACAAPIAPTASSTPVASSSALAETPATPTSAPSPTIVPTQPQPTATPAPESSPTAESPPAPTLESTPRATPEPTPTLASASSAPTAIPPSDGELIFYLDNDGRTIFTIRPDGTDRQRLLTIDKTDSQLVTGISASSDGRFLSFGLLDPDAQPPLTRYFMVENGQPREVPPLGSLPVWFGARRFTALVRTAATPGEIGVFDVDQVGQPPNGLDPAGIISGAIGTTPSWSRAGTSIVYLDNDSNIRRVAADPAARPTPETLLTLNQPGVADDDRWGVSWAALSDNGTLVFAGQQRKQLGASGNGQFIWAYDPATNQGIAGLTQLNQSGSRYSAADVGFVAPDTLVVGSDMHVSACATTPLIELQGAGPGFAAQVTLPLTPDQSSFVHDVSPAPYRSRGGSTTFAYSLAIYSCDPPVAPEDFPASLYVWSFDTRGGEQSTRIADGRYPVWVDTTP